MTSYDVSGCVHGAHVRNYFVFNNIIFGSRHIFAIASGLQMEVEVETRDKLRCVSGFNSRAVFRTFFATRC